MASRLPFHLAQGEREAPVDYLSRLAFRNGRDDLRLFAGDFRLDLVRVADGDPEAVGQLADLGSTNAESLAREAFVRTERSRHYLHKGNVISRRLLSRDRVRVCVSCLQEDVERLGHRMEARPHRRSDWCIVPMRTCARHGMALVMLDPVGRKGKQDTTRVLAAALPALDGLARSASRRTQSPFESYVTSRIEGCAHNGIWLDQFPLYAVAYVCTYLGATDVHGPDVAIARLDDDRLWECEARGFEIASGGEPSIRELLDRTIGRFQAGKRNWAPVSLFGQLWLWLAHRVRDPVYDPLRGILARHSVDTLPLGPEDTLFCRKVGTRRIHSINTASAEYGIHVRKLRKLLVANGYVDASIATSSDDRTTFDAHSAAPFLETLAKGLNLDEAAQYLCLPIQHRRSLLDGGLLRPWIAGGTDVLNSYVFRREDLDAFVASLLQAAKPEFRDDPSLADIQAAARRVRCGNAPIVRFLLEGRLKRVGVRSGATGYQSVLVDPKEVLDLVRLPKDGQLSRREAERELRVRSTTITGLLSLGALEGVTGTRMVGRRRGTLIPKASIDGFRLRYAGLGELAKRTGVDPKKLRQLMEVDGIRPAFEHAIVAAYYFQRSEVGGWLGRRIGRSNAGNKAIDTNGQKIDGETEKDAHA